MPPPLVGGDLAPASLLEIPSNISNGQLYAQAEPGARKYSKNASETVGREMHEMKRRRLKSAKSGKKVSNPKQAIAISLSKLGGAVRKCRERKRDLEEGLPSHNTLPISTWTFYPEPFILK
jgi:hypothetical protein